MADFSCFSESDESTVEDIISQAMDQCVLEQIASINLSGISDTSLPTDLESRFSKLKSFPGTNPKLEIPQNPVSKSVEDTQSLSPNQKIGSPSNPNSSFGPTTDIEKRFSKLKSFPGTNPKTEIPQNQVLSPNKEIGSSPSISNQVKKSSSFGSKPKSKQAFIRSCSSSSDSSRENSSSSLAKQNCFFWCSPKKVIRKQGKETRVSRGFEMDPFEWDKDNELISDLTSFNREAEKIVEWAKQASSRIEVSEIEDLLTDDDFDGDCDRFK
ncbi:uncharacterized protein LOC113301673 [Papaver somniferum]|uniref:uncharacterized protein LOC113301673 n=1 Tax=Papaver somniferum TaxID=3469 RepID=UPI000E6F4F4D|nr:uncharacterized protein LOC113301673 [Papaver somniferum]